MNQYFLDLLLAWYQWATAGAPQHPAFDKGCGLCFYVGLNSSYYKWLVENLDDYYEQKAAARDSASARLWLQDTFYKEFGTSKYPFNRDRHEYEDETKDLTCHLNTHRLHWVRQRLVQYGMIKE